MKKLSGFRQLSLNCDSPQTPPRRPPLKKQFSEEIREYKAWPEHDISIKISLNNRNLRNPFIKNAWIENAHETFKDEPVIIKKCSENRRIPSNSLVKQNSTENEISKSRQDLADKLLKQTQEGKPNIRIFLAQHSKEQIEEENVVKEEKLNETPKLIQSLTTGIPNYDKNSFKLRKNAKQKTSISNNEKDNAWQVPNKNKTFFEEQDNENIFPNDKICINDVKPIDSVIIRPATAASKREMFQKRTNSAFNATINVKETLKTRKPLIRSSSAPCKPDHLKTKISSKNSKHKPFKKVQLKTAKNDEFDKLNEDIPKSQKELNRTAAVQGNDVVTMVSLISPSGSDAEEEDDDDEDTEDDKMKNKNGNNEKCKAEQKAPPKIISLRKAVKTVSFQQSSIHAIRSFSASFPARRASVTAAMMLNNKIQEKRGTYSSTPDDDERVPKRRLVRCNTEETKNNSFEKETLDEPESSDSQKPSNLTVELKYKEQNEDSEKPSTMVGDVYKPNVTEEIKDDEAKKETKPNPDLKSPKEKQCWSMYCKMAEKGINISFDTILRGMLTPTEYRISKKHLLANATTESSENPK